MDWKFSYALDKCVSETCDKLLWSMKYGFQAGQALEEKLKASGVPHEVHFYPKTGHAFMNSSPEGVQRRRTMGESDVENATVELAWSRFRSWMSRFLSA